MGSPVVALSTIGSIKTGMSVFSNLEAANSQRHAIKMQIIQERIRRSKEQIDADDKMKEMNANQIALAASSGFDYAGSSANLTASNIDKFGEDSAINQLGSDIRVSSLKSEYKDVAKNAWLNIFSTATDSAEKVLDVTYGNL